MIRHLLVVPLVPLLVGGLGVDRLLPAALTQEGLDGQVQLVPVQVAVPARVVILAVTELLRPLVERPLTLVQRAQPLLKERLDLQLDGAGQRALGAAVHDGVLEQLADVGVDLRHARDVAGEDLGPQLVQPPDLALLIGLLLDLLDRLLVAREARRVVEQVTLRVLDADGREEVEVGLHHVERLAGRPPLLQLVQRARAREPDQAGSVDGLGVRRLEAASP